MRVQFENVTETDTTTRKFSSEGYLDVLASVYRSGIFAFSVGEPPFLKSVVPDSLKDAGTINVLVPRSSIEDEAFLNSLQFKPITNNHPKNFISPKTNRYYNMGMSTSPGRIEDENGEAVVYVDMRIMDSELISEVHGERRKQQTSIGNTGDITWKSGEYKGQPYHAVMENILADHIAIVKKGRAETVGLMNSNTGGSKKMVARVINGVSVEIEEKDAQHFDMLQTELKNSQDAHEETKKKLEETEKELTDTKVKLENSVITEEEINQAVADRVETINVAKLLDPEMETTESTRSLKIAVINSIDSETVSKDASDEIVNAVFKTVATMIKNSKSEDAKSQTDSLEHGAIVMNALGAGKSSKKNEGPGIEEVRANRAKRINEKFRKFNGFESR